MEQHPNFPLVVSPRWVTSSWEKKELVDPAKFAPLYLRKTAKTVEEAKKPKQKHEKTSLFRGCLFAFLRVAPPDDVVDFSRDDLEESATANGGQCLSQELVDALRIDKARGSTARKCYVVCWGSYESSSLSIHSLIAQMTKEGLGEVIQVTPVWLKTSVAEQKVIAPSRCTEFFVPPKEPLRKLRAGPPKKGDAPICVCVTGFSGFRRKAIRFLLQAMGADYDDSLRPCTTHLICQDASGSKYEKAKEWNIHTVSIDWLYHVAEYGYRGAVSPDDEVQKTEGCEAKFLISCKTT